MKASPRRVASRWASTYAYLVAPSTILPDLIVRGIRAGYPRVPGERDFVVFESEDFARDNGAGDAVLRFPMPDEVELGEEPGMHYVLRPPAIPPRDVAVLGPGGWVPLEPVVETEPVDEAARDAAFDGLARAQRGTPENAMNDLQHAQIAQHYGWLCEHVGDLTHRMSERFSRFHGQYGIMREKVEKTLNGLEYADRELNDQLRSNFEYHRREGTPWYPSIEAADRELVRLGKVYADAHSRLRVYNDLQRDARDAAVALGLRRFAVATACLRRLLKALDMGRSAWASLAGRFDA